MVTLFTVGRRLYSPDLAHGDPIHCGASCKKVILFTAWASRIWPGLADGDSVHRWESLYPVTCPIYSLFLLRWFATSIHSLVGLVALGPSSFFLGDLSCVRRLYCFRHGYRPIPACSRGINTLPQVVMLSVPPFVACPSAPLCAGGVPRPMGRC